jgi:dephospho-CoA kinase
MTDMIVIGLTGSIGMGKTTAANMLREMGLPVHCSDEAVALLYGRRDVIERIASAFPDAFDKAAARIDRARLKAALGGDAAKLEILQEILHPLVREEQRKFLMLQRQNGAKIACLDIPLLFETGAEARLDYTICVSAPPHIQRQRVLARPGMTEAQFAFILSRQMPDAEKRRRADFVVSTGLGLAQTRAELAGVMRKVREKGCRTECGEAPPKRHDKGPKP